MSNNQQKTRENHTQNRENHTNNLRKHLQNIGTPDAHKQTHEKNHSRQLTKTRRKIWKHTIQQSEKTIRNT